MNKNEQIKQIMADLKNGKIILVKAKNGIGKAYIYDKYIMWEHFGSSAIKTNLRDLKWLFNVIFESYDYKAINKQDYYSLIELYKYNYVSVYNAI